MGKQENLSSANRAACKAQNTKENFKTPLCGKKTTMFNREQILIGKKQKGVNTTQEILN